MMGDRSKTSGVPRRHNRASAPSRPAPGGSSTPPDSTAKTTPATFARHTLQFLIEAIKRARQESPPEDDG